MKSTLTNGWLLKSIPNVQYFPEQSMKRKSGYGLHVLGQIKVMDNLERVVARAPRTVKCYRLLCICTVLFAKSISFQYDILKCSTVFFVSYLFRCVCLTSLFFQFLFHPYQRGRMTWTKVHYTISAAHTNGVCIQQTRTSLRVVIFENVKGIGKGYPV